MIDNLRLILQEYTTKKIRFMFWHTADSFYTDCFLNNFNQDYIKLISPRINQFGLVVRKEHNFLVFKTVDPSIKVKFSNPNKLDEIYYLNQINSPNELLYRRCKAVGSQLKSAFDKMGYLININEINHREIKDFKISKKNNLVLLPAIFPRNEFVNFVLENKNSLVKTYNRYMYNNEFNSYLNSISEQILLSSTLSAGELDLFGCNYQCSDNLPWVFKNIKKRITTLNNGGGTDKDLLRMINLSSLIKESYLGGEIEGIYDYLRVISAKFQFYLNDPKFRIQNAENGDGGFLKDFWLRLDEDLGSCISWWNYEA